MWTVHNHTVSHSAGLPQQDPDTHFPMVHSVREKFSSGSEEVKSEGLSICVRVLVQYVTAVRAVTQLINQAMIFPTCLIDRQQWDFTVRATRKINISNYSGQESDGSEMEHQESASAVCQTITVTCLFSHR